MPQRQADEQKPEGWDKLGREGSAKGAEVGYCPRRHLHYHVLGDGSIEWHERPEGVTIQTEAGSGVKQFIPEGYERNPLGSGWVDTGAKGEAAAEEPADEVKSDG